MIRTIDIYFVPGNMYEYRFVSRGIHFAAFRDKDLSPGNRFALENQTLCMFIKEDECLSPHYKYWSLLFLTKAGEKIWIMYKK